jgi:hypothetical protein
MRIQALGATAKVKTAVTYGDHAVSGAGFVGTHIGEFFGIAPPEDR